MLLETHNDAALQGGYQDWLTWLSIQCKSTRTSSTRGSKNQDFPLSQADELHNTGTKTYRTGKFESSCGCFPKQIMKEYSALNSKQPNYAFYSTFIYESADHRLEGQTFFPLQPLVTRSGEPRKDSLKKFSPVLFRKKGVKKKKKRNSNRKMQGPEMPRQTPCQLLWGGVEGIFKITTFSVV